MGEVFLKTLNMSIAASWLILVVVLLRFVLKKTPKWIAVLLWGIVALRLAVPFSFESALSLIPSAQTIPEKVMSGPSFDVQTGIAPIDDRINDYLGSYYAEGITVPAHNGANTMTVLSALWIIGIVLLIVYTAISYIRVRRSVSERVPYEGNIFLCDHVRSPFILGLVRPRIYLPSHMDMVAMESVIAHEKAHLKRRDHWWKPLGFLILTVHWSNPLCWIAYVLLCRDIELACDEKVIRQMDVDGKKQYSVALLECSAGRRLVTICPLAFGEVGVKERIKNVLNYKKSAFWVIVAAVIACGLVTVCFATSPKQSFPQEQRASRAVEPQLTEAFSQTEEEAVQSLKLTKDMEVDSRGDMKLYRRKYLWCGMELDTDIALGYGVPGSIRAITSIKKETEWETAEACFDLFKEQFGNPLAYTVGSSGGGTNYEYTEGAEKGAFQEYHGLEGDHQLAFRFYLNDKKLTTEWVEYRLIKAEGNPGEIELHFSLQRSVRAIADQITIEELREKYPEYFELGTFKGLEVYVWQMAENDYRFGLMQGTNREKTQEEKMALKGASAEEMALILSTYDIEEKDIFVIPWQNPISSYMVTEDMINDPEYLSGIRAMLGLTENN